MGPRRTVLRRDRKRRHRRASQPSRRRCGRIADGGGKAPAIAEPIHGIDTAARFLADLGRRMSAARISLVLADVNGQPGAIARDQSGQVVSVLSLDMAQHQVQVLRGITNPDKLGHISLN